jgi:vancomycin resistance protein YoaR
MPKLDQIQPDRPKPPEQPLELEDFQDDSEYEEYEENAWQRSPLWLRFTGSTLVLSAVLIGSFEFVYSGKIFPGVSADGVYLGGLTKTEATKKLNDKITDFSGEVITITNGDTSLRIPVASLDVRYDIDTALDLAYNYGKQGSFWDKVHQQARALLGRATNASVYTYSDASLVPFVVDFDSDVITPVTNASLSFDNNQAQVTPAQTGSRLDLGLLTEMVVNHIRDTNTDPVTAPVYQLTPDLDTAPLEAAVGQINDYVSGPITLNYQGVDRQISQKTIISWIEVASAPRHAFLDSFKLEDLYPPAPAANLGLSHKAVEAYVADLAGGIDQTAQNAQLAMQDGQLTILQPSRNGAKVDQASATDDIIASLNKSGDRQVDLKIDTITADVNETNLASLGIKEQISEGETFFPGSPSTRLTNIRVGAKRFNDVLIKPGDTFSFGKILGDVGPAQGYVPELVILADHEEKQYGGGLCQVASTAYRAALLAGLPITERHNHSFAVSYYTAPYGVPGVDATIYYPQVDLKFVNDTGSYILIQTTMVGTTLKFDYFGTKTKSGVIRGPEFISGTTDAKKASHTVFYRDILDLAGNVTKTDTVNTYYKPSTDFPINKQYN